MKKLLALVLMAIAILIANVESGNAQVSIGANTYTTLKLAFDAINAGTHTGNIVITITGNTTETAAAVLNASGQGAANYSSVTLYPTGTYTISGSIATNLVEIKDADNVTFDGRVNQTGTTQALTFQNNNTSAAVIRIDSLASSAGNSARNVKMKYLNVIGGSATTTNYGITTCSSAGLTTYAGGFQGLEITNNNISKCYYGVRIYGLSTSKVTGALIAYNNFGANASASNGHYYAIYTYYCTSPILANNTFTMNNAANTSYAYYVGYSDGAMVNNNIVTGCTSTATLNGIYLYYTNNAQVNNNLFTNNSMSTFYGIYPYYSNNCSISNNTISNNTGTSTFYLMYLVGSNNTFTNNYSTNNTTSGTMYGIYISSTSTPTGNTMNNYQLKNNNCAGTFGGIYSAGGNTNSFQNILIENNTNSSGTTYGIYNSSSATNTYNNSTVKNLVGYNSTYGAYVTSSANVVISNNTFENIRQTYVATTNSAYGVYVNTTSNNCNIINNSITGIYDAMNKTGKQYIPSGIMLYGSRYHKVWHNSVNLYGNSYATNPDSGYSAALVIAQAAVDSLDIRNNSFRNSFVASATSKSYAVYIDTALSMTGSTIDYNDYYVDGPQAMLCYFDAYIPSLTDWQTATTQDVNSKSVSPMYNSNINLRPLPSSPLLSSGTPIATVTTDRLGVTRSATSPTLGAFEVAGDFETPQISYIPLPNTTSTVNRVLTAEITDNTVLNKTTFAPRIYYKKASNANTFVDNTNATNGWKYTSATSYTGSTFTFIIDYSKLYGGLGTGGVIEYFVVAQDSSVNQNFGSMQGTFNSTPTSVNLVAANFPITGNSSYVLAVGYSGVINVGAGETYTTLTDSTGLFNAMNAGVLVGNLEIKITSDITESGNVPLLQMQEEGTGGYQIMIYPTGNYTISGNKTGGLIEFRGSDRITIDGRINKSGSSNGLTITNSSASGAVLWIDSLASANGTGANNITVKYCNIIGGSATGSSSYGIAVSSSTSMGIGALGNHNIVIQNNNIYRCYYGIRIIGINSVADYLNGIQVKNNNFGNNGVSGDGHYYSTSISYSNAPIIQNNYFRTNVSQIQYFIYNNYGPNATITGNIIEQCTTTSTFNGINSLYSNYSTITNNIIRNNSFSAGYLIEPEYSIGSNISFNTMKNNTGSSTLYPIYQYYGRENTLNSNVIENNVGGGTAYGIYNYYSPANNLVNNTIKNLTGAYNTYGINVYTADTCTVAGNTIENIICQTTSTSTYAAVGIEISTGTDDATVYNNSISGIFDSYNSTTATYMNAGIRVYAGLRHKFYYNSVNLYGENPATNSAGLSAAFYAYTSSSNNMDIRNNTFVNTMNNYTGSTAYSIYLTATGNLTGTTIDYNNYFSSGTQAVFGYIGSAITDLTSWQTATAQDANSISANPLYNSNNNLRPYTASPLDNEATPIATISGDKLNVIRDATTPTIGAFEQIGDFDAPSISYTALLNTAFTSNRTFNATITDLTGVDATANKPRVYFKKTSNANTYVDNTNATNGWKYTIATGTGPFSLTIDNSLINGGIANGDTIQYFVVAQDLFTTPVVGVSSGTFATTPTNVALTAANFPYTDGLTSYRILPSFSGTINVGSGQTYTSLTGSTGLFNAMNNGVLTGNLNIQIVSNLAERGAVALKQLTEEGGSNFQINIYPTGVYTIADTATNTMIEFQGVDNVTFDGRINGTGSTNSLTLINYSDLSGAVVRVDSAAVAGGTGAKNIIIRNLNIIGGSPTDSDVHGIAVGSSSSVSTGARGNDNIQILYNNVSKCYYGIRVIGVSGITNYLQGVQVKYNNLGNNSTAGDHHYYAIRVDYSNAPVISNNTVSANTNGAILYPIYAYYCYYANISNNTVTNCSVSTFYGIEPYYSTYSSVTNNEVSNNTSTSSLYGYYPYYAHQSIFNNNVFKNNSTPSSLYGVYSYYSDTCTYNTFIIENNTNTGGTTYGMYIYYSDTSLVNNCKISNLNGYGITDGIIVSGSPLSKIMNCTIENVRQSNPSSTASPQGIYVSSSSNNLVIVNNSISGIFNAYNTTSAQYIPSGINLYGSTGHYLAYNSINLYGQGTATNKLPGASAAMSITNSAVTGVTLLNNSFANSMTATADTTYKAYALYISSATSLTGATINYNNYFSTGTNATLAYVAADVLTLLDLQTATGQDVNSLVANPLYNSKNNLRPFNGSALLGMATPLALYPNDKLNVVRSATTPTIGAFEQAGDFVGPEITFSALANTASLANRTLQATITDLTGVDVVNAPRIYFKKTTNANTFADNTNATNGWKYTVGTGNAPNFTFTLDYTLLNGGASTGDRIEYFIIAQDTYSTPMTGVSSGTFTLAPTSVALAASNFPVASIATSYLLSTPYSGTFEVGSGKTFTSLTDTTGLFNALNLGIQTGNINIVVTSNLTENGAFPLNAMAMEGGNDFTITIKPSTDTLHNITGAKGGSGLIRFVGTDRVTIDGRFNNTGKYLRFANSSEIASSSVIQFVGNGNSSPATNNTIRNTIIQAVYDSPINYGILVNGSETSATTTGADNDNISILENDINTVHFGIYVYGESGSVDNLLISKNNIGSTEAGKYVAFKGIVIKDCNAPQIKDNIIRNVINPNAAISGNMAGIDLTTGIINNAVVTGNIINNVKQPHSSGYGAWGIAVYTSTSSNALIANNFISDLSTRNYASTTYYWHPIGILIYGGDDHKIINNTVLLNGAQENSGTFASFSFGMVFYTAADTGFTVKNNIIIDKTAHNITGTKNYALYVPDTTKTTRFAFIGNNIYYAMNPNSNSTAHIARIGTNDRTTLESWQTAISGDLTSISQDVNFTAAPFLNLDGASIFDAALSAPLASEITNDIHGEVRSASNNKKGADVVVPVITFTDNILVADTVLQYLPYEFEFTPQVSSFGDAVARTVGTGHLPAMTYSWYFNNNPIVSGANNYEIYRDTLLLLPALKTHQGAYHATVNLLGVSAPTNTCNFIVNPYETPELVSPLNDAINVPLAAVLNWTSVSGATHYIVQVTDDQTFATLDYSATVSTNTATTSALAYDKDYFWRVAAVSGTDTSHWTTVWTFNTVWAPLATVSLTSPANLATNISINPTLTWNSVATASAYVVELGSDINLVNVLQRDTVDVLSFNPTVLNNNTIYYWRVRAYRSHDNSYGSFSSARRFTTQPAALGTPILSAPADLATNISVTPNLSWVALNGANAYICEVSLSNTFNTLEKRDSVTTTSVTTSALSYSTTYYWRVKGYRTSDNTYSPYSVVRSFTTEAQPLLAPTLSSPADLATNVSLNPNLVWNESVSATSYTLQVSLVNTFATTIFDGSVNGLSQALSGLANSTQYFWRVKAHRSGDNAISTWSVVRTFTTGAAPLDVPNLVSPLDLATNVVINPTISWTAVQSATHYTYELSLTNTFATVLQSGSVTTLNHQLALLDYSTQYFWRVKAYRSGDNTYSDWSLVRSFTTRQPAPSVPTLVVPSNNATGIIVNPTLAWNASTNATSYRVQLAEDNAFNSIFDEYVVNVTSKSFIALSNNTQYFWRVRAYNSSDTSAWSEVWNFTTVLAPLAVPTLSAPIDLASSVSITPNLSWNPVASATAYIFEVSNDNTFANVIQSGNIATLNTTLSALNYSTTYFWRVKAFRSGDNSYSDWSSVWSFTTIQPVVAPTLDMPANLATNVQLNPTISWNSVPTATDYTYELSLTNTFANILQSGSVTTLNHQLAMLNYSTQYFWRVKAYRSGDNTYGPYSAVRSFTTVAQPLVAPTLDEPADLATGISLNPVLSWLASATATSYTLQVSTVNTFATTIYDGSVNGLSQDISSLSYSTQYFWRVKAYRSGDNSYSDWSAVRSFTTLAPTLLDVPTLATPANNTTNVVLNPTLTWNPVLNAIDYRIQVSTTNTFATFVSNTIETATSKSLSGLAYNTSYFWRVRAMGTSDTSDWSPVWKFTTEPGTITQNIPLTSGWNMISGNVTPSNTAISSIVSPLAPNMTMIKNAYGNTYWPPFLNTLTQWNIKHAYQVRMTAADTLPLTGMLIAPENTPIILPTGWYWLPYYRTSNLAPATALTSIAGHYSQVKSLSGQVYWPPFFNTLTTLEPNKGYLINVTALDTLTYPANSPKASSSAGSTVPNPQVFVRDEAITGSTALVALEIAGAEVGDEIGIFTREGLLVGSSVWADGSHGVVVWGDDEMTTAKDGAAEGEELLVKIWKKSNRSIGDVRTNLLADLTANKHVTSFTYSTNAVYKLAGAPEMEEFSGLRITPQPATSEVYIHENEANDEKATISLYNQAGQVVLSIETSSLNNVIKLDTSDLSSGVYQLVLTRGASVRTGRVVIMK